MKVKVAIVSADVHRYRERPGLLMQTYSTEIVTVAISLCMLSPAQVQGSSPRLNHAYLDVVYSRRHASTATMISLGDWCSRFHPWDRTSAIVATLTLADEIVVVYPRDSVLARYLRWEKCFLQGTQEKTKRANLHLLAPPMFSRCPIY